MKVITFLHKASLIATALLTLALPGCHKEDTTTPAPSDATNAAQPASEQIPAAQDAQNEAPPLEESRDQQANADQDLQILKTATDNDSAEQKPDAENTSDTESLLGLADNAKLADGVDANQPDWLDWNSFDLEKELSNHQAPSFNWNTPRTYYNIGKHKPTPRPKVELYPPEVTGSLNERVIAKIASQHSIQLEACYIKELSKTKDLEGKVTITWIIRKNGHIFPVKLKESTLNNRNMENCLIKVIKTWVFPASKDGNMTSVEFPIEFKLPKS